MFDPDSPLPAPCALAIAYAPVDAKVALGWLLTFDLRLQSVLDRAREPLVAQLRLAWWRDALKSPAANRPKGEPLLAELDRIADHESWIEHALILVDAAEACLYEAEGNSAHKQRITAICEAYGKFATCQTQDTGIKKAIVAAWGDPMATMPRFVPRSLRPLSILALSYRFENADHAGRFAKRGFRLIWHALTGR